MSNTFRAMVVSEVEDKVFRREIKQRSFDDLPTGDVLINVKYSSLNYKDALSATGNKGVTRKYPHTPGIDAAGVVVECKSGTFEEGDKVLVTGFDLGMNTSGGFGEYIRVPAEWVVRLPENLDFKDVMAIGTAGFTAGLSVFKILESGRKPSDGKIIISGASGGVGGHALSIMAKEGFEIVAVTGLLADSKHFELHKKYLLEQGASEVIPKEEAEDHSGRPLLKGKWAGIIDTVGGNILSTALKSAEYGAVATCCGNAADYKLDMNVYPFILRGVTLFGIDSVMAPASIREKVWNKYALDWKTNGEFGVLVEECGLAALDNKIELMLKGHLKGRVVVNLAR